MASNLYFTPEEMLIDQDVGYPIAYKKLCRDESSGPFDCGPPFTFTPSPLSQQEERRYEELDEMFPVIDIQAKPTTKTKTFVRLLWKQLNHLGNAGFDPGLFRIDPYGNVLYYHADAASPLAWDIDHWFPLSRGGLTVASNLRILQWQVCQKKHNQLEILIPWWDLQLGISINQFLSIFASVNSDFRHRAFSWLFSQGESEELNNYQTVDSHVFPHHFIESKEKIGLAPAAVVLSRRESHETSSVLRSLDINRKPRPSTPIIAAKKFKPFSKENEEPCSNPYQAIVLARDSLRQREETAKMEAEIKRLDAEASELKQKTEEEKLTIQDLELVLIKRKRRAEKCRRLAEAQSSYRTVLEKMIRDALHQSVVYKEQVRLNQAAANALMARLEAQKAICDTSERELHKKHIQRDDLEKQIRPDWENTRKRSRMDDILALEEDDKTDSYFLRKEQNTDMKMKSIMSDYCVERKEDTSLLYLQGSESQFRSHKELRKFLEEEQQRGSVASCSINKDEEQEEIGQRNNEITLVTDKIEPHELMTDKISPVDEDPNQEKLQKLNIGDTGRIWNVHFPVIKEPQDDEDDDEESKKQRGKGNIEKWLQMLLDAQQDASLKPQDDDNDDQEARTSDIVSALDLLYPHKEFKVSNDQESNDKDNFDHQVKDQKLIVTRDSERNEDDIVEVEPVRRNPYKNDDKKPRNNTPPYRLVEESRKTELNRRSNAGIDELGKVGKGKESRKTELNRRSKAGSDDFGKVGKGKDLVRSESARMFRRIPSSPSLILSGMKKRVDCIGKKPLVIGDDEEGGNVKHTGENLFRSTIKTIKKAVKM